MFGENFEKRYNSEILGGWTKIEVFKTSFSSRRQQPQNLAYNLPNFSSFILKFLLPKTYKSSREQFWQEHQYFHLVLLKTFENKAE